MILKGTVVLLTEHRMLYAFTFIELVPKLLSPIELR